MKCSIPVPDEAFAAVDDQATRLGTSCAEFFAIAAERYIPDDDAARILAAAGAPGCRRGDCPGEGFRLIARCEPIATGAGAREPRE